MIIDYSSKPRSPECEQLSGGKVTVDREEVREAWYVDTKEGVVKSYDVLGDGRAHHVSNTNVPEDLAPFLETTGKGVLYKTLRGAVRLFRRVPETSPALYELFSE